MAYATNVATGANAGGATASVDIPFPASVSADDIALLFIETANEPVPAPSGWTEAGTAVGKGTAAAVGATCCQVFWRRCTGSEGGTNVAVTNPGDHVTGKIRTYSGCPTSGNPINAWASAEQVASSTADCDLLGLTTTATDCLVIMAAARTTDSASTLRFTSPTHPDLVSFGKDTEWGTTAGNGGGGVICEGESATARVIPNGSITHNATANYSQSSLALMSTTSTGGGGGGGTTHQGSASLSGAGTLVADPMLNHKGVVALAGTGTLVAAGKLAHQGSAALAGTGTLSAAARMVLRGSTALVGTGTLTAAGELGQILGAASLVGTGTLTAAGRITHHGSASLIASGTMSATWQVPLSEPLPLSPNVIAYIPAYSDSVVLQKLSSVVFIPAQSAGVVRRAA